MASAVLFPFGVAKRPVHARPDAHESENGINRLNLSMKTNESPYYKTV